MFKAQTNPCRECGELITGYVDQCPHCFADKPVPMPKYYYVVGFIIAATIVGLVVDYPRIFGYFFGA